MRIPILWILPIGLVLLLCGGESIAQKLEPVASPSPARGSAASNQEPGEQPAPSFFVTGGTVTLGRVTLEDSGWVAREQRTSTAAAEKWELEQRLQLATRLRQLGEQAGSPELQRLAGQVRQRADEYYQRLRTQRCQCTVEEQTQDDASVAQATGEPAKAAPAESASGSEDDAAPTGRDSGAWTTEAIQLTNPDASLTHRFRSVERDLNRRLEASSFYRRSAEQTGEAELLARANALEAAAWREFDRRSMRLLELQPGSLDGP